MNALTPTAGNAYCRALAASAAWDRMADAALARDNAAYEAAKRDFRKFRDEDRKAGVVWEDSKHV